MHQLAVVPHATFHKREWKKATQCEEICFEIAPETRECFPRLTRHIKWNMKCSQEWPVISLHTPFQSWKVFSGLFLAWHVCCEGPKRVFVSENKTSSATNREWSAINSETSSPHNFDHDIHPFIWEQCQDCVPEKHLVGDSAWHSVGCLTWGSIEKLTTIPTVVVRHVHHVPRDSIACSSKGWSLGLVTCCSTVKRGISPNDCTCCLIREFVWNSVTRASIGGAIGSPVGAMLGLLIFACLSSSFEGSGWLLWKLSSAGMTVGLPKSIKLTHGAWRLKVDHTLCSSHNNDKHNNVIASCAINQPSSSVTNGCGTEHFSLTSKCLKGFQLPLFHNKRLVKAGWNVHAHSQLQLFVPSVPSASVHWNLSNPTQMNLRRSASAKPVLQDWKQGGQQLLCWQMWKKTFGASHKKNDWCNNKLTSKSSQNAVTTTNLCCQCVCFEPNQSHRKKVILPSFAQLSTCQENCIQRTQQKDRHSWHWW